MTQLIDHYQVSASSIPALTRPPREGQMRRRIVVGVAAIALLGVAPVARADQPMHTREDDVHIDQFDTTSCAFPFREIADGFVTRTVYVDENGTPTRVRTHFSFDGVAINEANGKTAQLQENLVVFRDLETGVREWAGMRIKATMPGGGALLLDVGRVVFDANLQPIFEAGQHQLLHEDFAEFCAAMA